MAIFSCIRHRHQAVIKPISYHLWVPKQNHFAGVLYLSGYNMTVINVKMRAFCFCLGILLPTLIYSPSHAGGQTYSHTKAHCILWGMAIGGEPAECRRRAITAVASTTTCRLKHHYKAKSGETWCVYKKQGFFGDDKKYWFLLSTAQGHTNVTVTLDDAIFARLQEIYNSMTHHRRWACRQH